MRRAPVREAVQGARRSAMRTSIAIAAPLLAVLFLPGIGGAQDGRNAQPAGRGAAPAPANYPPYARPVSTYVPPRTADGQPDISGLYVGIPLPQYRDAAGANRE